MPVPSPSGSAAATPPAAADSIVTWHGYPAEEEANDLPDPDGSLGMLRKNAVFYRALIEREGRDEPWATELEQTTYAKRGTPQVAGVTLEGIKCARTMCAVVFSAPDSDLINYATSELRELVPPKPGGYTNAYDYRMRRTGRSFATIFMTRQGVPLQMPPRLSGARRRVRPATIAGPPPAPPARISARR